jgi:tetratricopeptide (TPR) repeat protein
MSMKCPNCDTVNAKTNKYCRQCGTRLDVLVSHEPEPAPATDEVVLGEELFAVLELFERGDLDAALDKSSKLLSGNPGSASAHSIVALVYERKAEAALAEGNSDGARDFLKRAIEHYEAIIDLNPDSSADREKLASLRLRHTGNDASLQPKVSFGPGVNIKRAGLSGWLRSIPRPAMAAAGALVIVVVLVVAVTGLTGGRPKTTHASKRHETPVVTVTPSESSEPGLRVYTYPQAQNPSAAVPLAPTPALPTPARAPSSGEVKPLKLPKIDQELTLVPEPKPGAGKPEPAPARPNTVEDKPPAPARPTGDSLLAKSIKFRNQGDTSEAIGAANQAIVLYRADIDAGKNTDSANRGIATATKYISIWQAALARSSE